MHLFTPPGRCVTGGRGDNASGKPGRVSQVIGTVVTWSSHRASCRALNAVEIKTDAGVIVAEVEQHLATTGSAAWR
jgi:hypothetical protein